MFYSKLFIKHYKLCIHIEGNSDTERERLALATNTLEHSNIAF